MAVYGGAARLATGREAIDLAMPWEHAIPLVDLAIVPYVSLVAIFYMPLFLMDRAVLRRLMQRYVLVTLAAGAAFLLVPTVVGLAREEPTLLRPLHAVVRALDPPHNAAPSLHVAYAVLVLGACARWTNGSLRGVLLLWLALLTASTWLTHQHQFADIVAGALLGWLGMVRLTPEQFAPAASARSEAAPARVRSI